MDDCALIISEGVKPVGFNTEAISLRNSGALAVGNYLENSLLTRDTQERCDLRLLFNHLKEKWELETAILSSTHEITENINYRNIVSLGFPVVNLILKDLKDEPNFWFTALREITGENPVQPKDVGNIEAMSSAWIEWGETRRLI